MAENLGKVYINHIEHDLQLFIMKKDKKGFSLDPGQLKSLKIGNTIQDQWLYFEAIYVDRGLGTISSYIADASTLFYIKIKNTSNRVPVDLELEFVVDAIAMIKSKSGEPTYKITGSHIITNALQQQVRMSFENESPTSIIDQIVKNAQGNIEIDIDPNYEIPYKTSYIADIDMTLSNHIERLCDIASGEKLGGFFISIDMLKGKLKSFSTRIDRASGGEDNKIRIFNLTEANNMNSADDFSNLFDWEEINGNFPAEMARDLFSKKIFTRFDHTTRKWTTTEYSIKKLNTIFTSKEMAYKFMYNPPDWEEQMGIVKDEYYERDDSLLGYKIRVASTRSNMLKVKVRCDMGIDVGSFIIIKSDESLAKKYGGLWIVGGVNHIIEQQKAITMMTLTRAFVFDDSGMGKTSKNAGMNK